MAELVAASFSYSSGFFDGKKDIGSIPVEWHIFIFFRPDLSQLLISLQFSKIK